MCTSVLIFGGHYSQSFDAAFLAALDAAIAEHEIDPAVVDETDAVGPASDAWHLLQRLAADAAGAVADQLLPPTRPLLVTEPGLLHRYQLRDFLRAMVEASRRDEAEAIVLLVPGHAHGTPTIEGRTAIPGLLPGQIAWLPTAWLQAGARPPSDPGRG